MFSGNIEEFKQSLENVCNLQPALSQCGGQRPKPSPEEEVDDDNDNDDNNDN